MYIYTTYNNNLKNGKPVLTHNKMIQYLKQSTTMTQCLLEVFIIFPALLYHLH